MKILIVDDHVVVRKGVIALLQEEIMGLEFHECESAAEGFDAVLSGDWDLIIADITMPGRSGLDMIRDIHSAKPRIPILVLSAHSERDYAMRVLKLGASGYLSKQSVSEALVTAVNRILAGGRYISSSLAEQLAWSLSAGAPAADHDSLSNRELEVLKLIGCGHSNKTAAGMLDFSEKTIATYRARIAEKLGISTNVDLARYALKHGLVD